MIRFACGGLLLAIAATVSVNAAPRVDNVLVRMVPPGVTSMVGAHMDQLIASELYQKLVAQQKLPQLDQFAHDTGFDPRHDVRELLVVNSADGSVLIARGSFNLKPQAVAGMRIIRHGSYTIHALDKSGYCILDKSLAAAGDLSALEAALTEWQHGTHTAAKALLASVGTLNDQTQIWGASNGFSTFLTQNMPRVGNGIDFMAIFKGVENTWFEASMTSGFQGAIHITSASEHDAMSLRDTAKGLIGFGRLSVPQNQPELLKFWDGFAVEQSGRTFTLSADIAGNLIDQMVRLLSAPGGRGMRGGRGAAAN